LHVDTIALLREHCEVDVCEQQSHAASRAGAVLVNVGRGSTVDEPAVALALGSGRLAGYGADVFAMEDRSLPEPPRAIPPPLLEHPRSVFTPHLGTAVADVRRAIELHASRSILQALGGERPEGAVNSP
jgi:phosphonate dehydrogenase